jgi:hypothetical protein
MSIDVIVRIVVYVALIAFLVFRLSRERKFPMASLWVWPAVLFVLVGLDLWATRVSSMLDFAYMIFALLGGTAFGWYLGTHSSIRIDKAARAAFVKTSPIGIALFIAALGARVGARYFAGGMSASDPNQLSPAAALAVAITLVFAVGLFMGQRLYVKQKYDETPA